MPLRKILCSILILAAGLIYSSCKTSTDATSNNSFSADISYDGGTPTHYVSDDFHIHFNRVTGDIDTLVITADKGQKADIFVEVFSELDSLHIGKYPISPDAQNRKKGVRVDHTNDAGTFFTSPLDTRDSITITAIDINKQAVKGTFHCTLYEGGFQLGMKAEITNGTFSWNY